MKNPKLFSLLILGSFLLFACSSPNSTSNIGKQDLEPQQEQPEPTETGSILQEEPAVEETQQTPTTEALTEIPVESLSDSNNLCNHPYFPIVDGASWTYDASMDEDYTLRIEETSDDSFKMIQEMHSNDLIYTVDWFCSEDGILRGSFGQADLINQAASDEETPEFQFETLEWEGQTLPSPELLNIGHTWTSFYQLAASFDVEGFSQSMNMDVIVDHEIIGMEEVIVPAGTFPEALRVDSDGQINMFLVVDEERTPVTSVNFGYSTWYVEGIGMVKTSSEVTGYSTDVSLTDSSLID